MLLLIPQRYEFSSKSQHVSVDSLPDVRCCWYHKGTNFQANHNLYSKYLQQRYVVADTTKVRIFKQITTAAIKGEQLHKLLLIPQRYEFSSKSQPLGNSKKKYMRCCWYHKGTNFQANHNMLRICYQSSRLLLIPQRYEFSSKSQHREILQSQSLSCCWYHKGTNFQANHNFKYDAPCHG